MKSTSNCFSSFCIAWKHRSSNDFPHCRSENTTFVKRHLIKTQKIIMYSEWCSVTDDMTAYCDPCFEKHTRYFAHIDHYGSLFREDSIIHTANQFGRCFRKQQKTSGPANPSFANAYTVAQSRCHALSSHRTCVPRTMESARQILHTPHHCLAGTSHAQFTCAENVFLATRLSHAGPTLHLTTARNEVGSNQVLAFLECLGDESRASQTKESNRVHILLLHAKQTVCVDFFLVCFRKKHAMSIAPMMLIVYLKKSSLS